MIDNIFKTDSFWILMQELPDYLYELTRFGIKPGLEVITNLLDLLDNPQNHPKIIHVTGTNGKGSTSCFIASILQEAGYKVGLYTSPHLIKFNERIKINGVDISDSDLVKYVNVIKILCHKNNIDPTFFEFTTAIAFLHFQDVDYAVIEVGLGGTWDATNVVHPEIAVITSIALDHTKYLGETLPEIARDKAGIIKPGCQVVIGRMDSELTTIFEQVCFQKSVKLHISSKVSGNNELFNINDETYTIQMVGQHQLSNASLAICVGKLLKIPSEKIKSGLSKAFWPGRLHFVTKNLLLDGAHNVAGMTACANYVKTLKPQVLVIGIAKDKEIPEIIFIIAPLFEHVIITQGNFKPEKTSIIASEVKKYCSNVYELPSVSAALSKAISFPGLVVVTGSLYLVGDVLKELQTSK